MAQGSKLTAEERNAILTLQPACLTVRGIAEATKRFVGVRSKVLSAHSKPKKSSRCGTKSKTSGRDRRHIIQLESAGDHSAVKVKVKLKLARSICAVQRALKSVDWLSYKKSPAQPAMMKRHKAARVA